MELLDEIRRAESEGESLIAKARQDSAELIREAREQARKLAESVAEECRQDESRMISEAESAAKQRSQKEKQENQKALDSLRLSAQQGIEPAVQLIITSIADKS